MPEQPTPNLWVPPPGVGLLRFRATVHVVTSSCAGASTVTIDERSP